MFIDIFSDGSVVHHENGRQQPGHGHGAQLPAVHFDRSFHHLRQRPQGDGLHPDADSTSGHLFHGRSRLKSHRFCFLLFYSFGFFFFFVLQQQLDRQEQFFPTK